MKEFLRNFKTYIDTARISIVAEGYQLTDIGIDYFRERYNPGSRQHIDKSEVELIVLGITEAKGSDDWVE